MRPSRLALAAALAAVLLGAGIGVHTLHADDAGDALVQGARDPRLAARRAQAQALPPAQRRAQDAARAQWQALAPAQRRDLRERWLAWQQLDPAERAALRAATLAWTALPPAQQAALRARFDALDDGERRGWRLGSRLGAHWPRLQPLFGYVAPGERDALLALLHGCSVQELQLLERLAFSTAPQERAALRAELVRVPRAQRLAWLLQRVER